MYLPSLFGTPGKPFSALYDLRGLARACVWREFATWATGKTSPIVGWLRALAKDAHAACGGPGLGAVGMCLTGGFALAMMIDDVMVAPVFSQPSLPFPVTVNYPDAGSGAGSATVNHFYVVVGVTPGGEGAASNRVGEFDFALAPGS